MRNEKVYKLTLTALMAALSYVVFTFLQIKIAPVSYTHLTLPTTPYV